MGLKEEPASFTFYERMLNFKLGFRGNPYREGHYTFELEGCPIEYWREAEKRERPTFDIGRSEITNNMNGISPSMKFPFIIHGKFMYLLIQHNKNSKFTKAQLGKNLAARKNLKLNQKDGWPLVLVCNDLGFNLGLKISVEYKQKNNVFDVRVQD